MSSVMPHDQSRYQRIKDLARQQELDSGANLPTKKLILKGKAERMPIFQFETGDLLFNKANGRVASEVLAWESENGRLLDADSPDDQAVLRGLLLSIRADENEKIKADLRKNGQIEPGIVTCDGVVINGNRRKALMEELYEETHDEQFKYLEVHVLPSSIKRSELWLIEAGIQLSVAQQLDYSPINHLLKLHEGIEAGLKIEDMAPRLYGVSEARLREDLDRLELIDEYLRDFLDKEGRYHLVARLNEHFIDLQMILARIRNRHGRLDIDWDPDDSDINELKLVAFYFIRDQLPHLRVRELQKLFCCQRSWVELRDGVIDVPVAVSDVSDSDDSDSGVEEPASKAQDDEFDEDVGDGEGLPETDRQIRDEKEERDWRRKHGPALRKKFDDAREQRQIAQDQKAPTVLADRALKNVEAIEIDRRKRFDPELDKLLGHLQKRVRELRKLNKGLRRDAQKGNRI